MPRNNRKFLKQANAGAENIIVGKTPEPVKAPGLIFVKTLQEALLAGLENPAQWARDFLGVDPYPEQEVFLKATRDVAEANFVAGNRTGKTHLAGVVLGWRAFYRYTSPYIAPEKQTPHNIYKAVSTSLTIDQAKLAWSYCLTFMTNSKRFKPFLEDYVYSPFPTIKIRTKNEKGEWTPAEIWARSLAKKGVYLLGHSINFLLVDECAYVPNYPVIEDETLRMRLADTGGSLFRFSTPNGRNFFYTFYAEALRKLADGSFDPRYFSYRIPTTANPYVSAAFIAEQRERMSVEYAAQNIDAEFISLSDFFKYEHIAAMYDGVEHELNGEPDRKREYVMGVDLGAMRDPTVCYVLDVTGNETPRLVGLTSVQDGSWASARALANQAYRKWRPLRTTIDATGAGRPVSQALIEEDGFEGAEEFIFGAQSKLDIMSRLQNCVQKAGIRFPFCTATRGLISQMSFYRLDDKALVQDEVIALALVNWSYEKFKKVNTIDTELYDDLTFIDVKSGGRSVPHDLVGGEGGNFGPGTLFELDPETGLFLPGNSLDDFFF